VNDEQRATLRAVCAEDPDGFFAREAHLAPSTTN
jgi:hypothetical protein